MKRMRAWSTDNDEDHDDTKRRCRTRSMDAAEEKKVESLTPDEWRAHHNITLTFHGQQCDKEEHVVESSKPYLQWTSKAIASKLVFWCIESS